MKNKQIVKELKNNKWLAYGGLTFDHRDFLSGVDNKYIDLCIGVGCWIPNPVSGLTSTAIYRLVDSYELPVETPVISTMKTRDEENIIIYACRYAHRRNTGAALQITSYIMSIWSELSTDAKDTIIRESCEATACFEEWEALRFDTNWLCISD